MSKNPQTGEISKNIIAMQGSGESVNRTATDLEQAKSIPAQQSLQRLEATIEKQQESQQNVHQQATPPRSLG